LVQRSQRQHHEYQQEEDNSEEENASEDEESDEEEDTEPIRMTDPTAEFEAIWAKRNHDDSKPSKTLYQVDRSLDLIQEKLI
jgi:hypothetical protein